MIENYNRTDHFSHKMLCVHPNCKQASECLRYHCAHHLSDQVQHFTILNPNHLKVDSEQSCPYHLPIRKVSYAKGFIQWLDNLPKKESKTAANTLRKHFSYRTYYRMRNGEHLLTPSEQDQLQCILKQNGITTPIQFDEYHEDYLWESSQVQLSF